MCATHSLIWYVLQQLRSSVTATQRAAADHGADSAQAVEQGGQSVAWAKLLQLLPSLLLAADGSDKRMSRFGLFAQGEWAAMLQRTLSYADKQARRPRKPRKLADVRRLAPDLIRKPGGIG